MVSGRSVTTIWNRREHRPQPQTVTDAAQSDLASGGNGSIVLTSTAGNITLNDGTATANSQAVWPTAAATSSSTPSTAT